jgi:Ribbon-helix-helix domain
MPALRFRLIGPNYTRTLLIPYIGVKSRFVVVLRSQHPTLPENSLFDPTFQYDTAVMAKPKSKVGKGKKTKTSIYLNEERLDALRTISDRTLISMAVLIRRGIDLVIAEYSKKS